MKNMENSGLNIFSRSHKVNTFSFFFFQKIRSKGNEIKLNRMFEAKTIGFDPSPLFRIWNDDWGSVDVHEAISNPRNFIEAR